MPKERKSPGTTPLSPRPATAWDVILTAVERGWGPTLRLCLLLITLTFALGMAGTSAILWR